MPATDLAEARLSPPGGFLAACKPDHLVYFVVNVGDGDGQVVLLPEVGGRRRAIVVDVADAAKLHNLLRQLSTSGLLHEAPDAIALVVATHPHDDHIRGMPAFLRTHAAHIDEVWEPGYYHPTDAYGETMAAIEDLTLRHLQPCSGTTRWFDTVKLTVLAPSVELKGRYDSYGIDINNSSIVLKIDYPAARVIKRAADRTYIRGDAQTIVLGADAQTLSWAQVLGDFPQLGQADKIPTAVATALRAQNAVEPLKALAFKVPHHGSKRGLNFELVEEISPSLCLFSCGRERGKYFFPHTIPQEIVREVRQAIATKPQEPRKSDVDLGIHYTGSATDGGGHAGSIGLLVAPTGSRQIWRFMDRRDVNLSLADGRRVT